MDNQIGKREKAWLLCYYSQNEDFVNSTIQSLTDIYDTGKVEQVLKTRHCSSKCQQLEFFIDLSTAFHFGNHDLEGIEFHITASARPRLVLEETKTYKPSAVLRGQRESYRIFARAVLSHHPSTVIRSSKTGKQKKPTISFSSSVGHRYLHCTCLAIGTKLPELGGSNDNHQAFL